MIRFCNSQFRGCN